MMWTLMFAVVTLVLGPVNSGYLVTTPRRWTLGSKSQICVVLTDNVFSTGDSLSYTLTEVTHRKILEKGISLSLPSGKSESCIDVKVPHSDDHIITLDLRGSLGKEAIWQGFNLTITGGTDKTFIQTDKKKYRPGQEVHFRILSVSGPNLDVVTDNYEEVHIENPHGVRVAQWLNVDNSKGLVHLSFHLYEGVREGSYSISAKLPDKNTRSSSFSVEDYVLPRYEVNIEASDDILGSDESVTLKLCAKYTFGEPVKGVANISLAAGRWKTYANLTQKKEINGCESFTFPSKDLLFDHNNCHIRIKQLKAKAEVEEEGTGVKLYASNDNIVVHRRALKFKDNSPSAVNKPYLPDPIHIAITHPNDKPAKNEVIEVCTRYYGEDICKNFTTTDDGNIKFLVPSQIEARVRMRAVNYPKIERNWNSVMEESQLVRYSYSSKEYFDPTNSSLAIYHFDKLQCNPGENIIVDIPVIYVVKGLHAAQVHTQIISRGQVVSIESMEVEFKETNLPFKDDEKFIPLVKVPPGVSRGFFNLHLNIPVTASPRFKLLVWYTSHDGFVVADSKTIEITECLPHNVEMNWSSEKVVPGMEANLIVKGANSALCSIGVVDKSVELLSGANKDISVASILPIAFQSEVEQWDRDQLDLQYCRSKFGNGTGVDIATSTKLPHAEYKPYSHVESINMFIDAGYFVHSSLLLEVEMCNQLIVQDEKRRASEKVIDLYSADAIPQPQVVHSYSSNNRAIYKSSSGINRKRTRGEQDKKERSYLPETWLWLLTPLSASGEYSELFIVPDTITDWVGRTVCVHPTAGVGISSASSIITFTPFFVDLTLPATAIRGETLPVKISIFNYLDDDLPVKVHVEPSEEYEILEGSGVRDICVPSKSKKVEVVKVKMTKIGDIDLIMEASSDPSAAGSCGKNIPVKKDRLIKSLPVEPEGYPREKTWTKYICGQDVENTGTPVVTWNMNLPEGVVEGSESSWITVIGDLIGPSVENLGHLVRLPTGCGEQNLVNFAASTSIREYLDVTGRSTEAIETKIKNFLYHGYTRQLSFQHKDGSFSAFGTRDTEGSTWLTAFVVKSFSRAKPYTLIDENMLRKSIMWLHRTQYEETGCFVSHGKILTKALLGGRLGGSKSITPVLTAYVLAALLEAGKVEELVIKNAIKCIETDISEHPYNMALKAYSLALAESHANFDGPSKADVMIGKLMKAASSNSTDLRWPLPDVKGEDTALHVETAAYALLALITKDRKGYSEKSRKIVRWLTGMRNGQGGFISTQDTVVALQALATFEKSQPREGLDMLLSFSSPSQSFVVTEENRLLQQRVKVPAIPNEVELTVSGTGCSVAQGVLRYHVLGDSKSDAFIVNVHTKPTPGKDCKTHTISVCTSYTLSDLESNMAIVEVKLVSGYSPIEQDLENFFVHLTLKRFLRRYEIKDRRIFFYFNEISSKKLCFDFRVHQDLEIEGVKPGSVTVYDYYQPEYIATQNYTLSTEACVP